MQVFEHEKISVGQDQFLPEHWIALSNHKKLIDSGVITLYNNAVQFSEFVEMFLNLCEHILHQGLIKKYRSQESNKYTLKGKLIVSLNIRKNLIHQERFYTKGTVYDRDNIYNRILLKAIRFVPLISKKSSMKDKVNRLLLDFPELPDIKVDFELFRNLIYDRKTYHYKEAIDIAAMLLLNYRPDITGGRNHVLAILFDMNKLWEEYIYRQLRNNLPDNWDIGFQSYTKFWELCDGSREKRVIPDIVLFNEKKEAIIIDTKWKLPEDNIPADSDLKQMFVYNEYWGGQHAILLYPRSKFDGSLEYIKGRFSDKPLGVKAHHCGLMKVSVINGENSLLDGTIGEKICTYLESKILV